MASRIRWAAAAAAVALLLAGCLDQRLGQGDPYRAIRGAGPPQPAPPLQIPTPPTAVLAAADPGTPSIANAAGAPATPATPSVQPAQFTQSAVGNPVRQIHEQAAARWASTSSYIVRLRRREVVNGKQQPEELMLVKFRKEPYSIYFKWLGPEAKGRESLYVKGSFNNQILTLNGALDIPIMPAHFVIKSAPDSLLVRARCRYAITEADFGSTIQRFGQIVARNERGDHSFGTLKHVGQVRRPEYERPLDEIVQVLAPRCDPLLPGGGERHWFFDPQWKLPVLVIANDHTGLEVEYYCNDRFESPVGLDDNDFNPDLLWKKPS